MMMNARKAAEKLEQAFIIYLNSINIPLWSSQTRNRGSNKVACSWRGLCPAVTCNRLMMQRADWSPDDKRLLKPLAYLSLKSHKSIVCVGFGNLDTHFSTFLALTHLLKFGHSTVSCCDLIQMSGLQILINRHSSSSVVIIRKTHWKAKKYLIPVIV